MTYTRINDPKQQRFNQGAEVVVAYIAGCLTFAVIGMLIQGLAG